MDNGGARIRRLVWALGAGAAIVCLGLGILIKNRTGTRRPPTAEAPTAATESKKEDKHEALMLAEVLKKKPDHTPVLMRLAQLAEGSGDRAEASKLLRTVVQNEPDNSEARLELGRVCFESGDVEGAIEHTRKILERRPRHADALYNLGAIYANIGNAKLAREYWNRAILADPNSESSGKARTMLTKLNSESL